MTHSRRAFLGLGNALVLQSAMGIQTPPVKLVSGNGSRATAAASALTESASPQDFMSADQASAVARRERTQDVTAALVSMFSTGARHFFFPPGDYPISMTEGSSLIRFANKSEFEILGQDAVLYDPRVYREGSLSIIFDLENCSDFVIAGLNYEGMPIADPGDKINGVGYRGATFVNLRSGCSNVEVAANLRHLRYGVRSGDFVRPEHGRNRNIRTTLQTYRCGYPIAHYLAEQVSAEIYAESGHRAAYLAGVRQFDVVADFKDQHIAPIQVLLTDAIEGPGQSRGCSFGRVAARDLGSTEYVPNSWCAGIALSRVDPGTIFENLAIDVRVVGTDRVATSLGACAIVSTANAFLPAYKHNWEPFITLRQIKISGIIDRSAQTLPGNAAGDLYVNTLDSPDHFATVEALDYSQLKIIPARTPYRSIYCVAPSLADSSPETEAMCRSGR